jgi:ferredoxin
MAETGRTTLYYFTGTGNSLAVARAIAAGLGGATLIPIASLDRTARITVPTEKVGIVCPVYFYTVPLIVREVLARLDLSKVRYTFLVLTMGGLPGLAVEHAEECLAKSGGRLDAAFPIRMLGNYIAEYNVRRERAVQAMLLRTKRRVAEVVEAVGSKRTHVKHGGPVGRALSRAMFALLGRRFLAACRMLDRRFTVDSTCIHCGTCARVCPVENVRLVEGRPTWLGHCEQCFACIHFCPVAAIQIRGKNTRARGRYHHPDVTAEDVAAQKAKAQ